MSSLDTIKEANYSLYEQIRIRYLLQPSLRRKIDHLTSEELYSIASKSKNMNSFMFTIVHINGSSFSDVMKRFNISRKQIEKIRETFNNTDNDL